ncbi:hypothetical protein BE15_15140, partial [Sorangium cellulosum]
MASWHLASSSFVPTDGLSLSLSSSFGQADSGRPLAMSSPASRRSWSARARSPIVAGSAPAGAA